MDIIYETGRLPSAEEVAILYERSGLPRPVHDRERLEKMYKHSDIVVTAWDGNRLVGACRSITDWVWCCYLSDLAVDPDYKKSGIGKKLIGLTKEALGEESMILLLSVPTAMDYYPKIGFEKEDRGFMIKRTR